MSVFWIIIIILYVFVGLVTAKKTAYEPEGRIELIDFLVYMLLVIFWPIVLISKLFPIDWLD